MTMLKSTRDRIVLAVKALSKAPDQMMTTNALAGACKAGGSEMTNVINILKREGIAKVYTVPHKGHTGTPGGLVCMAKHNIKVVQWTGEEPVLEQPSLFDEPADEALAEAMKVAEVLREIALLATPAARTLQDDRWPKTRAGWLREIDRMVRLDEVSIERQLDVARWLRDSSSRDAEFWRKNVRSTETFRKRFDRLEAARGVKQQSASAGWSTTKAKLDEMEEL